MTDKKALAKAKELFGPNGCIQRRKPTQLPPGRITHTVGRIALGMFFEVKGQGMSWEEAFGQHAENLKKYGRGKA